jgi:hypothetical protein
MVVQAYDDGDGRWDIFVVCDDCGHEVWTHATEALETEGWHIDEDDKGNDRCLKCQP